MGEKKKKKDNPHKREYGIEIIKYHTVRETPFTHCVSIDIGFRTAGLTWYNRETKELQCLNYKKKTDCQVQGMKIVDLLKLCDETIEDYVELLPREVMRDKADTRFILEEPLIIAGQRSFSISLYVLLGKLIEYLIYTLGCHSVVLVRPGSAKKLLGVKSNVKMPDSKKTEFIKALPNIGCKNNHQADSVFSNILCNQEELKQIYASLRVLSNIEYKTYYSEL